MVRGETALHRVAGDCFNFGLPGGLGRPASAQPPPPPHHWWGGPHRFGHRLWSGFTHHPFTLLSLSPDFNNVQQNISVIVKVIAGYWLILRQVSNVLFGYKKLQAHLFLAIVYFNLVTIYDCNRVLSKIFLSFCTISLSSTIQGDMIECIKVNFSPTSWHTRSVT